MSETNKCELVHLGKDVELHEQLKRGINDCFEETRQLGIPYSKMGEIDALLNDLTELRKLHGLPSDGRCYMCSGNKCVDEELLA